MRSVSRFDLNALQAEPAWKLLQVQLETEHNDLVTQLAYEDLDDKKRAEKRGRLLLAKEILTWVDRTEQTLPKEAK